MSVEMGLFNYNQDFLGSFNTGDTVAVHWDQVVKVLTSKEIANLEYWTQETLDNTL